VKLQVLAVGEPGRLLADAISEYERRAARYWPLEVATVRAERAGKGRSAAEVMAAEAERLLRRVHAGVEIIALTRTGETPDSAALSAWLSDAGVRGSAGLAFLIGGAFGLGEPVLERARRRLALSSFTLPHDLARLVLAEQLYRAGTIARGEPYHKGAE
jgi:23S rRNA (pseudouridine1915-N3)-methyltransferase